SEQELLPDASRDRNRICNVPLSIVQAGLIAGAVKTLRLVMRKAKRAGLVPANPVTDLERSERPSLQTGEKEGARRGGDHGAARRGGGDVPAADREADLLRGAAGGGARSALVGHRRRVSARPAAARPRPSDRRNQDRGRAPRRCADPA